ncbi:MAG: Imm1 family immunity protein [Stackebrandtia sp.]
MSSPGEVERFLTERAEMYNNWGTRGMTYWIGPHDTDDAPLRIDMDPDAGAAAVRWLPDGGVGIKAGYQHGQPLKVCESSDEELMTIPAELVCASIDAAQRAAVEYVRTGQRPANLEWTTPSIYPVTTDPVLNSELVALEEAEGINKLMERISELGLTPPGHVDGDSLPTVSVVWTEDMDDDADGVVAWDIDLVRHEQSDLPDDTR